MKQCVVHWACRNSNFNLGNIANACLKYIAVSSINEGIKPPFNKIQTMFAQKTQRSKRNRLSTTDTFNDDDVTILATEAVAMGTHYTLLHCTKLT